MADCEARLQGPVTPACHETPVKETGTDQTRCLAIAAPVWDGSSADDGKSPAMQDLPRRSRFGGQQRCRFEWLRIGSTAVAIAAAEPCANRPIA